MAEVCLLYTLDLNHIRMQCMFLDSYQKYVCLDLGKNDEYLIFWSPMFFNFSPTPLIFCNSVESPINFL